MNYKIITHIAICLLIGSNSIVDTHATNFKYNTLHYNYLSNQLFLVEWNEHNTILSTKERKHMKKEQGKNMNEDLKFKIGEGVTVTSGPMKGMYGVFIYYDEKKKYLIRFTGTLQLYYNEGDVQLWKEHIKKKS